MKSETFIVINDTVKAAAAERLILVPCDGKVKVTFSDIGSKSSRQNSLWWMWCTQVAKSGMGGNHEDNKDGVNMVAKHRFVLPLLVRDDEFFNEIYSIWKENHFPDPERMGYFTDKIVHTASLSTNQMSEALTDFHRHYTSRGIYLTHPDDRGLLEQQENKNG